MPRNQTSSKVLHLKHKLTLDVLEDRSLPGNSILGAAGFENPFKLFETNIKQLSVAPSQAAKAATTGLAKLVQTSTKPMTTASSGLNQLFRSLVTNANATRLSESTSPSLGSSTNAGNADLSTGGSSSTPSGNGFDTSLLAGNTAVAGRSATSTPIVTDTNKDDIKQIESFIGQTAGKYKPVSTNQSLVSSGLVSYNPGSVGGPTDTASADDGDAGTYDLRAILASGNVKQLTPAMLQADSVLRQSIPGLSYTVNSDTGTPNQLMNINGYLTSPSTAAPLQVVTNFLNQNKALFGLQTSDINAITVNYQYKWNNNGPTMLYLQQKYNGISMFDGMSTATVMPNGQLVSFANNLTPNLAASVSAVTPTLTAQQAIAQAAQDSSRYLGINLTNYGALLQTGNEGGAERAVTYSNSTLSVDPIPVRLNYLTLQTGDVRLVWNLRVYIPNSTYLFEYNIDAKTGEVLTRQNWIQADSYRVFATPVRNPDQGSRTLVVNPADSTASPYGWHDTNGKPGAEYTYTRGNNVLARVQRDADPGAGFIGGTFVNGVNGNNYDFGLNLRNDPSTYIPAAVTNLFYWNNSIHDALYNLGFNEPAGNFQQNNYGKGGLQNDPVYAYAQAGANIGLSDNAFFVPSADGTPGRMAMFIANLPPNGVRDLDFENDTIAHEYFHGVSSRLVGGPNIAGGLNTFSARGLGEGWSDINALFMTTKLTDTKNTTRPFGGYTGGPIDFGGGNITNTAEPFGFRNYPYSYDMSINPSTFADIDYSQAVHFKPYGLSTGSFYQVGEVWAATVNDMYWNLVDKYGYSSDLAKGNGGNNISMRLVLAGLAMTSVSPTVLGARNAILAADWALNGGANQYEIWSAFARRGMGVNARDGVDGSAVAPNGATLPCVVGVVESFDIPSGIIVTPPTPPAGGDGSNDSLYEPNETSNAAFDLGTVTGLNTLDNLMIKQNPAGTAGDRDWFKFTPTKAGTLTLTVEVSPSAGDLDVKLYKASGSRGQTLTEVGVGQGTKRAAGTNEVIKVAVTAGATYYFNVAGYNLATGNYNLLLNAPA